MPNRRYRRRNRQRRRRLEKVICLLPLVIILLGYILQRMLQLRAYPEEGAGAGVGAGAVARHEQDAAVATAGIGVWQQLQQFLHAPRAGERAHPISPRVRWWLRLRDTQCPDGVRKDQWKKYCDKLNVVGLDRDQWRQFFQAEGLEGFTLEKATKTVVKKLALSLDPPKRVVIQRVAELVFSWVEHNRGAQRLASQLMEIAKPAPSTTLPEHVLAKFRTRVVDALVETPASIAELETLLASPDFKLRLTLYDERDVGKASTLSGNANGVYDPVENTITLVLEGPENNDVPGRALLHETHHGVMSWLNAYTTHDGEQHAGDLFPFSTVEEKKQLARAMRRMYNRLKKLEKMALVTGKVGASQKDSEFFNQVLAAATDYRVKYLVNLDTHPLALFIQDMLLWMKQMGEVAKNRVTKPRTFPDFQNEFWLVEVDAEAQTIPDALRALICPEREAYHAARKERLAAVFKPMDEAQASTSTFQLH